MARLTLFIGALLGGSGVMAGAFASHALRGQLSPAVLATFETAVRYQLVHALALLAVGLLLYFGEIDPNRPNQAAQTSLRWSGICFTAGTVLFSGSLYSLSLGAFRSLGWVTPLGGLGLIGGWAGLAIAAWQLPSNQH